MTQLCLSQLTLETMNSGTMEMSERSKKEEEYQTIEGSNNVAFHFCLYGLTAPQKQMWMVLKSILFDLFYLFINNLYKAQIFRNERQPCSCENGYSIVTFIGNAWQPLVLAFPHFRGDN